MAEHLDYEVAGRRLSAITKTAKLLNETGSIELALQQICDIIREAYVEPDKLSVYISYDHHEFRSADFKTSRWLERHLFDITDKIKGIIEIHHSGKLNEISAKELLKQDNSFIANIGDLISGKISNYLLAGILHENTERIKELTSIHRTAEILKRGISFEESLQEICLLLPEAFQYPAYTAARITFGDMVFTSRKFKETPWVLNKTFETPKLKTGTIEIYYLKEFPVAFEGPFLKEELMLINTLSSLISNSGSQIELEQLIQKNAERLKELRGLNQTSLILRESRTVDESLQTICAILPEAYQYPEYTAVRITYDSRIFTSKNFIETLWVQRQSFESPKKLKGIIEVFYLKEFPEADEGPFLKEERDLLINIASLIAGSAIRNVFNNLLYENRERLKELKLINQTTRIISMSRPVDETLQKIVSIIPGSWQYPGYTAARIRFEGKTYVSRNFSETMWVQKENFITVDNKKGIIEVFYQKEFPDSYEGPFMKEERNLIFNLGKLISGYLNNYKGREIINKIKFSAVPVFKPDEYRQSLIRNKRPLQLFFNQQTIEKYIYLDMMKYKVKEILFVATLYDAFTLENESSFFEQFMGIIYQYSLFSLPRITGVTTTEEAMGLLDNTRFDLVIIMVGMDRETPVRLSDQIREKCPDLLIYLLLNQKSNIQYFEELVPTISSVNKLFMWTGDSQIFFAMVKSIEDQVNVENDTKIGLVRIILLIEDSAQYYSKYLPILYSIVFGQVQQVLPEVEKNELDKICKMRSRPKILHATNYEDAMSIFEKYKDFLLCVISDVEFERDGRPDKKAGIRFIKYMKSHILNLPIILQSSEKSNEQLAGKLNVSFINKNSETLLNDLKNFLNAYLGFGDFIFRDKEGRPIAVASSMREFESLLKAIPDETFYLHASENQFSLWLMARGEIELARTLNPLRIDDIRQVVESKKLFIDTIKKYKDEKKKGKVLNFDETATLDEKNIVSLSPGSFGGKGRGLAFINALVNNLDFSALNGRINIRAPVTAIVGTDEFEDFIERNDLFDFIINPEMEFGDLKNHFIRADLSESLIKKLEFFLDQVEKPIAVRSSSISEDSLTQPFAGIFDTYILPNNRGNKKSVLKSLVNAIKLVYASVFSGKSKNFFRSINHKVEEEKMAIVLQELVGAQYDSYYYPHLSGVAQSFNYYPVAHMKPEEGFAVVAFGLGSYVMEGWNSYRFSPKYPNVEMFTTKDLINTSQVKFYALDCSKNDFDYVKNGELASLLLLDISEAEKQQTLNHCVSVYNPDNDRIEPGLSDAGPRILNFADILKYDYIPLAETIDNMLITMEEALGSPVEIEYAVDLNRTENNLPSFYLLQIKPLIGSHYSLSIDFDKLDRSQMLLYTRSSLGNGEVNYIQDVIFIDIKHFDKLKTQEMVAEIDKLNNKMIRQNKQYILIGPGRWGTRDPFLGIPVIWPQISNAKVIVEVSLANFPLDSSLGSHFFHNLTSMNIGYFSIQETSMNDFIRWNILDEQYIVHQTRYFKHVRFEKPLLVYMDGRIKTSAVIYN
ncbi:MAG: hypothetical protein JXB19_02000 [Bacteroidales bacterium]|nr:hypothetical protein [Bacteroidales bacterium]